MGLQVLSQKHAIIGEVQGKGLMARVELVSDRQSKTPIDPNTGQRIFEAILERGIMVRVSDSSIGLAPPLIIEADQIEQIIHALDDALFEMAPR